jgi:lipopolysaccharide/colanic/teichoic acid biosynthesis glycosyltransferase
VNVIDSIPVVKATDVLRRGLPRWLEASAALVGLVLTAPVLAGAAAAIALTSRGGVLFRQARVGRAGLPFTMLKLRTMTTSSAGPQVTADDDRRITAVGRVLRKLKLDELPALWNVVRGDLSLVGPRPEVPRYVDASDPLWREVLAHRPGLTDPVTVRLRNEEALLASVPGDREAFYRETLQPFKLAGYAAYLRHRSWLTDLGVIWWTLLAVVSPGRVPPPTLAEIASGSSRRNDAADSRGKAKAGASMSDAPRPRPSQGNTGAGRLGDQR